MNRVTITAGIGEDRDGNAIPPETLAQALAVIRGTLAQSFGGFTELDSMGGWIADEGRLVMEAGRRWIALTDRPRFAKAAAETVRRELRQAAVVLEVENVPAMFVTEPQGVTYERA